jgi:predicted anti-sigma-YlaC factor YlaD
MSHDEIVCREFVEVATEYLDGALPESDLERVEEHLVICALCRTYLDQIAATATATATALGATDDDDDEPPEATLRVLVSAFAARDGRTP